MNTRITPLLLISLLFGQDAMMPTMAVWDFDAANIGEGEVKILTDRLTTKLTQLGKYTVIERKKMKEVLEEQGFQHVHHINKKGTTGAGRTHRNNFMSIIGS
jgi:curli biogenesis system outer membrane secretion channel CsgG